MSRTIKKEITCPACGEKADAKMWASVNVTLDQELLPGAWRRYQAAGGGFE